MAHFCIRFINSGNTFVGRAINWCTNSLMDHVEIITEAGTYIGAHSGGGVQERSADYCRPTWELRYAIPCTDEQYGKIMALAHSKIGTKYNFLDIMGLLFKDRKLNSPKRLICSQFVLEAAQAGGMNMLNVADGYQYLISPETLHLSPLLIGNCTYRSV